MTGQRGLSVVELVVGALLASVVAAGLLSAYLATARSFGASSAQAALHRQGALALEDIGRQVRGAELIATATCNGRPESLQVTTAAGTVCYYARPDGALCEARGNQCRNVLAGGLTRVALMMQPSPADPRCPPGVAAGAPCFRMTQVGPSQVDLAFTIRDDGGSPGAVDAMAFQVSLTCSGRNC